MAFLSSMNISASGLTAQQLRLDIVAENVTNSTTTRVEGGEGSYRRKMVVFEAKSGRTTSVRPWPGPPAAWCPTDRRPAACG